MTLRHKICVPKEYIIINGVISSYMGPMYIETPYNTDKRIKTDFLRS